MEKIPEKPRINIDTTSYFVGNPNIIIPSKKLRSLTRNTDLILLSKELNLTRNAIYNYLNGSRYCTLNLLVKLLEKEEIGKLLSKYPMRFGHGGNAASAVFPNCINPEIAYLVGALRDGTINDYGKYEVCYIQKEVKWLRLLSRLLKKIFKPTSNIRLVTRKGHTPKITLSNRPIYEYFRKVFDVTPGSKITWGTPKIILKMPKEIQKYYIRGFFDADGVSGQNVGFCQANLQSLLDIKGMLKNFGIKFRPKLEHRKTSKGNDFYYIYILKKYKNDFFDKIGSSNPSKSARFA